MIIVVPEELSPIINSLCLRGERLLAFPLEIEVANAGLLDRLHDSRVDLAVVQHVGEIEGFNLRLALSDPIGFVATPMHPLAQNLTPLRLRDLSGIPLLLPPRQNWIRQLLDDAAYRVGLTLTMRCVVDRLATIKTLVRENLGCAVMPVSAVQHEVANGTLIFRPISRPSMVGLHAVAHRQNATGDILSLAAILHSELQDYASNGRSQGLRALTPGRCHVEDWYAERENGAKLTG